MLVNFLKQSWLVIVSSLVFGLLVAGASTALEPRIKRNAAAKIENEMKLLLAGAQTFDAVRGPDGAVQYWKGLDGDRLVGYAFRAQGGGFADKISLLVAVDGTFKKLLGIAVLASNETPGFGDKMKEPLFRDQFNGCPAKKLSVVKTGDRSKVDTQIVAITGATITSTAVVKIVNHAVAVMQKLLNKQGAG